MKKCLFALIALAGSTLFALLLIEGALRLFPVRSYIPFEPVTAADPVLRFKPNVKQVYAAGWDFDARNVGHTNAQGYIADFDFETPGDKPLIAVIGDSYVEARMVPFADTLQERIRASIETTHRVYGMGIGGSPLSQYLTFAAKMRDEYKPEFMIISIVANDFDESLPQYKNMPRFHYFVAGDDGALEPRLIGEYKPSPLKDLISHSALVRYAYFHLSLDDTVNRLLFSLRNTQADDAANTDDARIADSEKAADAFLALLPRYSGLPKNRILLVIDGVRGDLYGGAKTPRDAYFTRMRDYMIANARAAGYEIVDLQPAFAADYAAHGTEFDFRRDRLHWNSYGYGVAAAEILKSRNLNAYLKR